MSKRFSQHCENNKQPILEQLSIHFKNCQNALEIGSGTGQHAVFFASQMPQLTWHTSDMPENHANILAWITESPSKNITPPITFTIGQDPWPEIHADAVFTANTTHIMQPSEARQMMEIISINLPEGGVFCQYGPMNVNGRYTSDSNREFDKNLKQKGFGGLRDIEQLITWGEGMQLAARVAMPANNFLLVWQK